MGAGESAQAEYDRRRDVDRQRVRSNLPRAIGIVILTGVVTYVVIRLTFGYANTHLVGQLTKGLPNAKPTRRPLYSAKVMDRLSLVVAGVATLGMARAAWGRRQSTEAWAKGAEGERRTAKALARLPNEFVVMHDLKMPGSRANIDHLVIGPTGVFTIDTKQWKDPVVVTRRGATRSGHRVDKELDQAQRQAAAVARALAAGVSPVLCIQGPGVQLKGWRVRPVVDGVRFTSGSRLVKVLTYRPRMIQPAELSRIASCAAQQLIPMSRG